MSHAEFAAAFPAGESDLVERKEGAGRKPLAETVVSFSNTNGGVILIGVRNDGEIVGRELTQGLEDELHEMIGYVKNPGRYSIHPLRVDGVAVTALSVAKREEGFAQTSDGRTLVRRGTRDEALFGVDLQQFLNQQGLAHFETTDTKTPLTAASKSMLKRLAEAFGWSAPSSYPDRLVENGLALRSSSGYTLTVAGALHLLKNPEETLGKTYVEILRFREDSENYDRRVQIDGPLREQVERSTEFVMDEVGHEVVVLGVHRHELPRLPRRVLREAIANAVAHRSYELNGTAVRIEIRPDAVTITSPGALPEPVTIENIRDSVSARNPHAIRVLRVFHLAEELGLGVDVMQDTMRDELLDPPVFAEPGAAVRVTLPVRSAVTPLERAWIREVEQRGEIEPSDRILLVAAARGEVLTNGRARKLLRVDKDRARAALQRLRDAGFLIQRGTRGGSTYALDQSLEPPAGLRLSPVELEDLVVEMAREKPIANADVRERTGLDRSQTLELLAKLVDEGRLDRTGKRRGTRYAAAARVIPGQQHLL